MRFAVYHELALALFPDQSYEDVAVDLTGVVPELATVVPAKSALLGARRRLGPEAMRAVFVIFALIELVGSRRAAKDHTVGCRS